MAKRNTIKVGDFYQTASGRKGIVAEIHPAQSARGRKVVEMVTLYGDEFATLQKGEQARVTA